MNIEKYSTLSLGNDKKYIVAEKLEFNNETYLMLLEEDEEIKSMPSFAKVKKEGLEFLEGTEKKEISDIMLPLFESDYV